MMEFFKNPEEWKNSPVVPKQALVEEVRAEPSVVDIVEPTTPQVTMESEYKIQ
jgi:hypothetical protein